MLNKKMEETIDPTLKAQKDNLNTKIQQMRDTLTSDVRHALGYSKLLTILPNNSKEYQCVALELDMLKHDIATDIAIYERRRKELGEFCQVHSISAPEWVSAYEIAEWATHEK